MRENKPVGAGLFVRFRVDADSPEAFRTRYARHVSRGGISLVGSTELPVETPIRFTVELKSGQAALTGQGVVRWCAPADEHGAKRWRIGLKFIELDLASRGLVATMVAGGGPALESLEPPVPEELSLLVDSWGDAIEGSAGGLAPLPVIAPLIAPAPPRVEPVAQVPPSSGPPPARHAEEGTRAGGWVRADARTAAIPVPRAIELFPEDVDEPLEAGLGEALQPLKPAPNEALELLAMEEDDWADIIRPDDLEPLEVPSGRTMATPAVRSIAPRIAPATGADVSRARGMPGIPVVPATTAHVARAAVPVVAPVAPVAPPLTASVAPTPATAAFVAAPVAPVAPVTARVVAPVARVTAPVTPVTSPLVPPTVSTVAASAVVPVAAPALAPVVAPVAPAAAPITAPACSRTAAEVPAASPDLTTSATFPSAGSAPSPAPPAAESPVGRAASTPSPGKRAAPGASSTTAADERAGRLGRALDALHHGDFETAESELYQAITLEPRSARLRHELGLLYVAWDGDDGHESAAEACFARAYELDPKQLTSLVQLGEVQLRRRLYAEARQTFERALRSDPSLRSARRGLERVEAMVWRQRFPRIAPVGAAAGLVLLAAAWLRPLRPTVISVPSAAIAVAPRVAPSPAANTTLAAAPPVAVASTKAPTSAPAAESARTDMPKPPPPQTVPPPQVVASREPVATEEASDGHRAEPEPEPTRARRSGHRSARRPRADSGKAKSSGSELAKLVKQGDSALRSGRVDEALKSFNQAIAENPQFAPAHRGLGSVFVMQGRDSDAKAAYRRYLALAPNAPDAPRIQALLQDM